MDHQSFRFYIPGVSFLFPIYLVACWIAINNYHDTDIRSFILVGGIATFPTIALPIGWWIYNAYRVWWIKLTKGGYENKEFVRLIRKDTKPFYSPLTQSILIDFSHISGIGKWIKFDLDIFRKTFYPFTSKRKFQEEIQLNDIHPKFTEPLSDFILWKDSGYDYARSISSVRYGLESSVFAIVLGGLNAYGLKVIWLYYLHQNSNIFSVVFWAILLLSLFVGFIITLFIRWKFADKEYDARLILTTLTNLTSSHFDVKHLTDNVPPEIVEKINQLNLSGTSFAAFDLDDTLLIDDIGEAVFATLLQKKLVTNLSWEGYINLLNQNREVAYKKVIDVMTGIKLNVLKNITHEIIDNQDAFVEVEGERIPIPKPNSTMQSIIAFLRTKGIDVFVVTASNKVSAEMICWKHFGISASNVIGAEILTDRSGRILLNSSKIPYGEGKVKAIINRFDKERPIVTGGDGAWDKFMLDYTKPGGIRLWLGQDKNEYQQLKNNYYSDECFFHIQR